MSTTPSSRERVRGAASQVAAINKGGFTMDFWARCGPLASAPSPVFPIDEGCTIDLTGAGFPESGDCWVSCNITAGEQNHESGDNFVYNSQGGLAVYEITGATFNPSWEFLHYVDDPIDPGCIPASEILAQARSSG